MHHMMNHWLTVMIRCAATVGVRVNDSSSHSPSASPRPTGVNLVYATIFCLHVLNLLNVLQPVDGASEIYLPNGWVRILPVLSGVDSPLPEQRCISLPAIPPLLGMYPWHLEDRLLLVQPFQSYKPATVDHPGNKQKTQEHETSLYKTRSNLAANKILPCFYIASTFSLPYQPVPHAFWSLALCRGDGHG